MNTPQELIQKVAAELKNNEDFKPILDYQFNHIYVFGGKKLTSINKLYLDDFVNGFCHFISSTLDEEAEDGRPEFVKALANYIIYDMVSAICIDIFITKYADAQKPIADYIFPIDSAGLFLPGSVSAAMVKKDRPAAEAILLVELPEFDGTAPNTIRDYLLRNTCLVHVMAKGNPSRDNSKEIELSELNSLAKVLEEIIEGK